MKRVLILVALLLVPAAIAQLDWDITDLRCGNGVVDDLELCEKGLGDGHCKVIADLLGIDTVCDVEHCTCLPRVNMAYCGNNRREGIELCDGTAEDFCPQFGNATNMSLVCDPDTCGCKITGTLSSEYDPETIEALINASKVTAVCGNKKIEGSEDCDPPQHIVYHY